MPSAPLLQPPYPITHLTRQHVINTKPHTVCTQSVFNPSPTVRGARCHVHTEAQSTACLAGTRQRLHTAVLRGPAMPWGSGSPPCRRSTAPHSAGAARDTCARSTQPGQARRSDTQRHESVDTFLPVPISNRTASGAAGKSCASLHRFLCRASARLGRAKHRGLKLVNTLIGERLSQHA